MSLDDDPACILARRARRLAKAGDLRKAALALRERASILEDAPSWVMAGAMWRRARRPADALAALRHGMWLHQRAGATARARTVARLIAQMDGSAHGVAG